MTEFDANLSEEEIVASRIAITNPTSIIFFDEKLSIRNIDVLSNLFQKRSKNQRDIPAVFHLEKVWLTLFASVYFIEDA